MSGTGTIPPGTRGRGGGGEGRGRGGEGEGRGGEGLRMLQLVHLLVESVGCM